MSNNIIEPKSAFSVPHKGTLVLIWIYFFVLLGCVFFRIEAWPFSDYRVFKDSHHPDRVVAYKVGVYNPDQSITWLFSGGTNKYIFTKIIFAVRKDDQQVRAFLNSMVPTVKRHLGEDYGEMILFSIKIQTNGDQVPDLQAEPYMRIPL